MSNTRYFKEKTSGNSRNWHFLKILSELWKDEEALQRAQVKPQCKSLAEESLQMKEETDFLNLASGAH